MCIYIMISSTFKLAGNGDVPIISDQRKNSVGGCVVHFSWGPPSDLVIRDISHYKIAINGTPIDDERNITKPFAMRAHPVCACGAHYISIATVNHCGEVGPNVTEVINYPEPDDATCEAATNIRPPADNTITEHRAEPPTCTGVSVVITNWLMI